MLELRLLLRLLRCDLWQGRFSGKAPDSGAILKDLDLDVSLKLPEDWHAR